jgi:hypothetical protein
MGICLIRSAMSAPAMASRICRPRWPKRRPTGAQVLWRSTAAERRASALVRFPGGYIAEIHQTAK